MAGSRLSEADVRRILDEVARICTPVVFDYRWRPIAADADDDFVLETAINGAAEVVASFDIRDMAGGAAGCGIAVERPAQVLSRIRL